MAVEQQSMLHLKTAFEVYARYLKAMKDRLIKWITSNISTP